MIYNFNTHSSKEVGFFQETFEFHNILQVHGFLKVMDILTVLFFSAKKLRKIEIKLKNRFWTEIYDGAKWFYSLWACLRKNDIPSERYIIWQDLFQCQVSTPFVACNASLLYSYDRFYILREFKQILSAILM